MRGLDAEPSANVFERSIGAQRRRRQHGRLHAIEQQLANDLGHVDRGPAQEDPASPDLQVIDEPRVVCTRKELNILADFAGAAAECEHVLRQLPGERDCGFDGFERVDETASLACRRPVQGSD